MVIGPLITNKADTMSASWWCDDLLDYPIITWHLTILSLAGEFEYPILNRLLCSHC